MRSARRAAATCLATLAVASAALAQEPKAGSADEGLLIEDLLKSGWKVAGFTSTFDNRSAMILFSHPAEMSLVQCLTGYDVTRTPRTYTNCYRLK
ncbi:MAG: hypothetical protein AB7S70_07965 [Hyphomicrobium sp.]|uniref:hypothetical protein n=1 Tax=Hyphomicrobium sp. TaxID=82 RepID=UPI003D0B49C7